MSCRTNALQSWSAPTILPATMKVDHRTWSGHDLPIDDAVAWNIIAVLGSGDFWDAQHFDAPITQALMGRLVR